jgi:large subunit ribosomal protein L31e
MAEERIYTIPLRKEFLKAPNYKRSSKAISTIKKFLIKHMKVEEVKIGKYLNLEIFKHGRKNPPSRIKVKAVKDKIKIKDKEVNIVKVDLIDAPIEIKEEPKKEIKKEEVKTQETKVEEKIEEQLKEKKETIEHAKLSKKERKTRSFVDKAKPTQEQKISGIIGSTGK